MKKVLISVMLATFTILFSGCGKEVVKETEELSNNGIMNSNFIIEYDGYYYLAKENSIYKSDVTDIDFEVLFTDESNAWIFNLYVYNDKLYYCHGEFTKVIDLEGNDVSFVDNYKSGYFYNGKLIYNKDCETVTDKYIIHDANLFILDFDGSNEIKLSEQASYMMTIYNDFIYYIAGDYWKSSLLDELDNGIGDEFMYDYVPYDHKTTKIRLDGSEETDLNINYAFAGVSKDWVLYWDYNGDLWRAKEGGESSELIYDIPLEYFPNNSAHLDSLNNTEDYIVLYYSEPSEDGEIYEDKIVVIDYDGNVINEISNYNVQLVSIFDDYIYFKSFANENVYRVYFDSQDVELLIGSEEMEEDLEEELAVGVDDIDKPEVSQVTNNKYESKYFSATTKTFNGNLSFIDQYSGDLDIHTEVLLNNDVGILVKIYYDKPTTDFIFTKEDDDMLYSDLVLGYFYETDGDIYKLNDNLTKEDLKYENNFADSKKVVCLDGEEIELEYEMEHTSISIVGDNTIYSIYTSGVETNYFERIEFRKNQGIVAYKRGYGAMRDSIDIISK